MQSFDKKEIHDLILNCTYKKLLDDSIYNPTNKSRIANVFRRALRGEQITVGYIGGSITCGEVAGSNTKEKQSNGYAGQIFSWLEKTFPNATFKYVNTGISGTNSIFGVSRMQKQLLSENPDLVMVDFIANDQGVDVCKYSYECLIRRLLEHKNNIGLLALSFWRTVGNHFPVLKYYDIPTINYFNTVMEYVNDGIVAWEELWHDSVHPNLAGHTLIAACVKNYFNTLLAELDKIPAEIPTVPQELYYHNPSFMDATLYQSDEISPSFMRGFAASKYQWAHEIPYFRYSTWEAADGGVIEFDIPLCKTFSVMRIISPEMGSAKIYINGEMFIEDTDSSAAKCEIHCPTEVYFGQKAAPTKVKIEATGHYIIIGLIVATS